MRMFFWKKKKKEKKESVVVLDTNIPLDYVKHQKLEFLNQLEQEAEVLVPWAVIKELMTAARMAEADKEVVEGEDFKEYMEWRDSILKTLKERKVEPERAEQIIRAREARIGYAEDACSFVQEKIESGKWKTIGMHNELKKYVGGFEERIKEMVDGRRADLEVLACCFVAAERYPGKEIILMSLDRGLKNVAERFGIRTPKGPRGKN